MVHQVRQAGSLTLSKTRARLLLEVCLQVGEGAVPVDDALPPTPLC